MDTILDWLKGSWDHSGGRVMFWKEQRKRKQQHHAYYEYQHPPLALLPPVRPRALTISKDGYSEGSISPKFSESRLLSLPPEIRLLIWEWAFGGNLIALYRDDDRLTHGLLCDTNSQVPGRDIPLDTGTIRNAVMQLPGSPPKPFKNPPRPIKLRALALLQSCRLV